MAFTSCGRATRPHAQYVAETHGIDDTDQRTDHTPFHFIAGTVAEHETGNIFTVEPLDWLNYRQHVYSEPHRRTRRGTMHGRNLRVSPGESQLQVPVHPLFAYIFSFACGKVLLLLLLLSSMFVYCSHSRVQSGDCNIMF